MLKRWNHRRAPDPGTGEAEGGWPRVRRDLLLGLAVWSTLDAFFYTRMYVELRAAEGAAFTWEEIRGPHALDAAVDALTWTLFTPLVLHLARTLPLGRRPLAWAVHAAASLVLGTLNTLINFAVSSQTWPVRPRFWPWMSGGVYQNVQVYWMAAAAAYALVYYRAQRARAERERRLEAQLARARLQSLEMQLQPHFLYNTLNSIAELVHRDPHGADAMIARLGRMLRMAVDEHGGDEVPLRRELEFIGAYLEIERTRFRDRLRVETRVDPAALDAPVPRFVLQPLVENALRHGLAPRAAPGTVLVEAAREGGVVRLRVRDDGVGLSREPATGAVREGVGIANTRARLRQLYGAAGRLELRDAPGGGVEAVVELPFRASPAPGDAHLLEAV